MNADTTNPDTINQHTMAAVVQAAYGVDPEPTLQYGATPRPNKSSMPTAISPCAIIRTATLRLTPHPACAPSMKHGKCWGIPLAAGSTTPF